jgi:hypothetical protein
VHGENIRIFGEMVGLLWSEGQHSAAIHLEELWNRFLETKRAALYCAYPIDVLEGKPASDALNSLFAAHTHICAGPRTLFSNPVAAPSDPRRASVKN